MNSRWFKHMLIAMAVLAAQWAGLAHSIEHREHLEPGHVHVHSEHSGNELLHSCLLFDGLSTAHAAISSPPTCCALPTLATLRTKPIAVHSPRNALFAQRVRVRDPPLFS